MSGFKWPSLMSVPEPEVKKPFCLERASGLMGNLFYRGFARLSDPTGELQMFLDSLSRPYKKFDFFIP